MSFRLNLRFSPKIENLQFKTNYIINYDLCIDISDNLISHIEKNNYYKISSRFLTLILKIDKNLLLPIFKTLARNTDIKWCSIIYESDEEKKSIDYPKYYFK